MTKAEQVEPKPANQKKTKFADAEEMKIGKNAPFVYSSYLSVLADKGVKTVKLLARGDSINKACRAIAIFASSGRPISITDSEFSLVGIENRSVVEGIIGISFVK